MHNADSFHKAKSFLKVNYMFLIAMASSSHPISMEHIKIHKDVSPLYINLSFVLQLN